MSGLWSLADSLEGTAVSMTVYSKGQRVLGCKGIGRGKYGTVQGWAEKHIRPGLFEAGRVEAKEDHYVIHWDGIEEPQRNIWCGKVRDIKFCMPQFAFAIQVSLHMCCGFYTLFFLPPLDMDLVCNDVIMMVQSSDPNFQLVSTPAFHQNETVRVMLTDTTEEINTWNSATRACGTDAQSSSRFGSKCKVLSKKHCVSHGIANGLMIRDPANMMADWKCSNATHGNLACLTGLDSDYTWQGHFRQSCKTCSKSICGHCFHQTCVEFEDGHQTWLPNAVLQKYHIIQHTQAYPTGSWVQLTGSYSYSSGRLPYGYVAKVLDFATSEDLHPKSGGIYMLKQEGSKSGTVLIEGRELKPVLPFEYGMIVKTRDTDEYYELAEDLNDTHGNENGGSYKVRGSDGEYAAVGNIAHNDLRLAWGDGMQAFVRLQVDRAERKANKEALLGSITNTQVAEERLANLEAGKGKLTHTEILYVAERKANEKAGRGAITDFMVVDQRKANEEANLGSITDAEVATERAQNAKNGRGSVTNVEAAIECTKNSEAGLGSSTNAEIESQRDANEKAGLGRLTDFERAQCEKNKAAGFGFITDQAVIDERNANDEGGRGSITDFEVAAERVANKSIGRGEITNAEADVECTTNQSAGFGSFTNEEVKTQRNDNQNSGRGSITNAELEVEQAANAGAGRGSISNTEVGTEKAANLKAGKREVTNAEWDQCVSNDAAGRGSYSDSEVKEQCKSNESAGRGAISNEEVTSERAANDAAKLGKFTHAEVAKQREDNTAEGYGALADTEAVVERAANHEAGSFSVTNTELADLRALALTGTLKEMKDTVFEKKNLKLDKFKERRKAMLSLTFDGQNTAETVAARGDPAIAKFVAGQYASHHKDLMKVAMVEANAAEKERLKDEKGAEKLIASEEKDEIAAAKKLLKQNKDKAAFKAVEAKIKADVAARKKDYAALKLAFKEQCKDGKFDHKHRLICDVLIPKRKAEEAEALASAVTSAVTVAPAEAAAEKKQTKETGDNAGAEEENEEEEVDGFGFGGMDDGEFGPEN